MCNWIHVSLGVVASLLGLLFLFHERDAATADSHLQDCEPPIHFTAAFSEEICSHPKEGYTVWRTGKDIICHCTDRRLQCPGTQFYVDDKDKKVFHVIFNEAYAVQSVLEAELGICHVEIPDIVSMESSQTYSEITTPVTPRECSTVSESDDHGVNDVLIGFVFVFAAALVACIIFLILQRKEITRLRQEKHGMNTVIQGLNKENDLLRMHTCPVRQAGDGGARQTTKVGVNTSGDDPAHIIDMDIGGRDNASAGHNTNGQAAVPNVDQNSLPSSRPSSQQPNQVLPSPNDVRVHHPPGVHPFNVVTLVNLDDNTAMGVHSTPIDFHIPPAGVHATPQSSEPASDTSTYQDVDTIPQRETDPLIHVDDEDCVKQRNEHDNTAQEQQS